MTSCMKFYTISRGFSIPYSFINNSNRFGVSQADPILSIYSQKLQEFKRAKQSSKGDMVDIIQEQQVRYNIEVNRLKKLFGGSNLETFPNFNFE